MHTTHLSPAACAMRRWTAVVVAVTFLCARQSVTLAASTWNPTLIVNTEGFQIIDDADTTANVEVRFGQTLNEKLTYDRTNARFKFSRSLYVGGTLTTTGAAIINVGNTTATPDTGLALEVLGTASGMNLYATKSVTGAHLYASTTFGGAGLTNCTGAANKLTWVAATKQFACEGDETGGGGGNFGTGNVVTIGNTRYVNTSGDTMTGGLLIESRANGTPATIDAGLLLEVAGTASGINFYATKNVSGSTLHARTQLRSSGTLAIDGAAGFDGSLTFGDALGDAITANAATWTFANDTNFVLSGGVNGLSFDTSTLSIDASGNRVGVGTTAPKTAFEVAGTSSGANLYAANSLTGSHLYATTTFKGAGLSDCTGASNKLTWLSSTKQFACESDQTGGAAAGISDHYVRAGGDTMTGGLLIQSLANGTPSTIDSGLLLEVAGTMSGRKLHVNGGGITTSGSLAVDGTAAFNNVQYTWPGTSAANSGAMLAVNPSGGQMSWVGPLVKRINGSSGAAGPYITWQNLTSNASDCTTTALCTAAMTTTGVGAGTWKYKYTLIYQTAATTTGIGFGIDHTGTVGQVEHLWYHITTGGAAATGIGDNDAATSAGQLAEGKAEGVDNTLIGSATAGTAAANTDILAILEGIIVVTASGNMELKLASEVATSAVRIMADSSLELVKIE